jgi:hypothetical protein
MIQYALKCVDGHSFDSWFQSAAGYDKLAAAGMVSCAVCGSTQVEKSIMAPRVRPGRKAVSALGEPEPAAPPPQAGTPVRAPSADNAPVGALSTPSSELEQQIAELRKKVEENSDYVGKDFVSQARAMHEGEAPERAIHGEARIDEAKALLEEGIPVAPLPFMPNRKTN